MLKKIQTCLISCRRSFTCWDLFESSFLSAAMQSWSSANLFSQEWSDFWDSVCIFPILRCFISKSLRILNIKLRKKDEPIKFKIKYCTNLTKMNGIVFMFMKFINQFIYIYIIIFGAGKVSYLHSILNKFLSSFIQFLSSFIGEFNLIFNLCILKIRKSNISNGYSYKKKTTTQSCFRCTNLFLNTIT